MAAPDLDVLVVGGGVAGLTAATFTARAGLDTAVYDHAESILAHNSHLENYPGFPAGVDARLFLELCADQAERSGAALRRGEVVDVSRVDDPVDESGSGDESESGEEGESESTSTSTGASGGESKHGTGGFAVEIAERPDPVTAAFVVAASWADCAYLDGLGVERERRGSKRFVLSEAAGRTDVEGLYAAGRLADVYHQTVVAAGHAAQTAISLIHESGVDFYHDWVAPEGYFTGRGRAVPPGCEEIDEAERRRREAESLAVMREYFEEPHPGEPTMHPSVAASEDD
jgi:glycine/D-amino acid oxidase-like deaminating enzyme